MFDTLQTDHHTPNSGTVFVLGNGPSLRNVDLHEFKDVDTIGMNAAYRYWERIGWYPTHYCCLDDELIATHHNAIADMLSEGLVQTAFLTGAILEYHPDLIEDSRCLFLDSLVEYWFHERGERLGIQRIEHPAFQSSDPSKLTTGAYAVRFGIYLGYHRLYLLGIDCSYMPTGAARPAGGLTLEMLETPTHNPNYFFDDYQQAGDRFNIPNPNSHAGDLHLQSLEVLHHDVINQGLGVQIYNCSSVSKLASEGVFPYKDIQRALGTRLLGAVAIPTTLAEESLLIRNLRSWNEPALIPRYPEGDGYAVPLVIVLSGSQDTAFEHRVRAVFQKLNRLRAGFSQLKFVYCGLSAEEDQYERDYSKPAGRLGYKSGPNAQFFRSMELLRGHGRYVFYMENDCTPIRSGWLAKLQEVVAGADPFWVMGSIYRGIGGLEHDYTTHVNGNAVYAVGDSSFVRFLDEIWRPALEDLLETVPTVAYDFVLPMHFANAGPLEDKNKWQVLQSTAHLFHYTDFIQNHGGRRDIEEGGGPTIPQIREDSPQTYIVHGRQFVETQGDRPVVRPQDRPNESAPPRATVSTHEQIPKIEAVVVHQVGKVGSTGLTSALRTLDAWPVFHTHVLNPEDRYFDRDRPPPSPSRASRVKDHIWEARIVRFEYLDRDRPVAAINAVREPIARNVSAFFENLDAFSKKSRWLSVASLDELAELYSLFREQYPHDQPDHWFDRQWNEVFETDIWSESFDPERGFVTTTSGGNRLLVYRSSLDDDLKSKIVAQVLGVPPFSIERMNVRSTHPEAELYDRFKTLVGRDTEYIERMLRSRVAQHFFSPHERRQIAAKWIRLGLRE